VPFDVRLVGAARCSGGASIAIFDESSYYGVD